MTLRKRPTVYYTPEEKEERVQRLRNRVPKVIVELIISFTIPLSNFQYMKSTIEGLYPSKKVFTHTNNSSGIMLDLMNTFQKAGSLIQRPFQRPFESSVLCDNCWYINEYPGDNRKLHNEYEITIQKIEKVVEYFKAHEKSTKNVFYTRNIELIENEYDSKIPLQILIQIFYRLKCPGFLLAYAHEGYFEEKRTIINFKITAKNGKKKVINFFKGLGKFVDWMKNTVPIIYDDKYDDRWMRMGYGYKMMIDDGMIDDGTSDDGTIDDGTIDDYLPRGWIQNRAYNRTL